MTDHTVDPSALVDDDTPDGFDPDEATERWEELEDDETDVSDTETAQGGDQP